MSKIDTRGTHGNHAKGSGHYRWNSSDMITQHGYKRIRVGKAHPLADPNGYAYEHSLVWISAGNPRPKSNEIIHHKNGDKLDNRLQNLQMISRGDHNRYHNQERKRASSGRFISKAAGYLLDGRAHGEFPK